MNSSSNSAQHSTLLTTGQVCRDREVPIMTGSLSCLPFAQSRACHSLSRAHCARSRTRYVRGRFCRSCSTVAASSWACLGLSCARLTLCQARRPALWVEIEKHPVTTPPLEKLCRDTRRPLLRLEPGPTPNPVVTLNLCCNTGPKNLCRDKEGLYRDPNHPACLGTVSRQGDLCWDTEPEALSYAYDVACTQVGSCA